MAKHHGSTSSTTNRPEVLHGTLLVAATVGWAAALATLAVCCWHLLRYTLQRQRAMRRQMQIELNEARGESTACANWDVQLNEAAMKAWASAAARAAPTRQPPEEGDEEDAATECGPNACASDRIQA